MSEILKLTPDVVNWALDQKKVQISADLLNILQTIKDPTVDTETKDGYKARANTTRAKKVIIL